MVWTTIYDLGAAPPASPSWVSLTSIAAMLCGISGWLVFRLWRDAKAQADPHFATAIFFALTPVILGAVMAVMGAESHRQAVADYGAARNRQCVWTEGRIIRHSRPGELDHGSMSFSIADKTFYYGDLGPAPFPPLCVGDAACDGEYVRVCYGEGGILVFQRLKTRTALMSRR